MLGMKDTYDVTNGLGIYQVMVKTLKSLKSQLALSSSNAAEAQSPLEPRSIEERLQVSDKRS